VPSKADVPHGLIPAESAICNPTQIAPKVDYGIAFIGCGGIMNDGYIPALKAHGFISTGSCEKNCCPFMMID
jgi:hypothetical protein